MKDFHGRQAGCLRGRTKQNCIQSFGRYDGLCFLATVYCRCLVATAFKELSSLLSCLGVVVDDEFFVVVFFLIKKGE